MPRAEILQRRNIQQLPHGDTEHPTGGGGGDGQPPNDVDLGTSFFKLAGSFVTTRNSLLFTREMMNSGADSSSGRKILTAGLLALSCAASMAPDFMADRERQVRMTQEGEGQVETTNTQASSGFLNRWDQTIRRGLDLVPIVATSVAAEYAYNKDYPSVLVVALVTMGAVHGFNTSYTRRR
jgi:hypothetical protein